MSQFPEVSRLSDLKTRRVAAQLRRGLLLFSWLLLLAASVEAEAGGIVLVSDSDVPAGITRSVKRRLGQVSDVTDQKRSPAEVGDVEFSKIAKRSGAALIVHLQLTRDRDLHAELRQGASGDVVSTHDFTMQGRRLKQPARALQELVAATRQQLSQAGAATRAEALEQELDEEPEASAFAEQEIANDTPSQEPGASEQQASSSSTGDEQIMEDPELSARLSEGSGETDVGPRQGLGLQASVGVGPGVHSLQVPMPTGAAGYGELDTGVAPVVSLAAAAQLGVGQWLLRAEAQYRTFFAAVPYEMTLQSMDGVLAESISSPLTSHSFVIGASPGYRFGGRDSVALMLLVGWTYRSLHAENETLPGVSLRGFVGRPALHIPFGDGVFCLRIAPELIIVQSSESNALGFTATEASGGVGWGAEVAVDVRLSKLLGAGLQYRRSRISATRSAGEPAIDEDWYVAVQAVLSL